MKTIKDVMRYCEGRAGTRLVEGFFVPCGGGLYALEQIADPKSAFPPVFYERQRIELQLLMSEIAKGK